VQVHVYGYLRRRGLHMIAIFSFFAREWQVGQLGLAGLQANPPLLPKHSLMQENLCLHY